MSYFLDRLSYFTQERESYADGHGAVTREDRTWEDGYRARKRAGPCPACAAQVENR